MIAEKINENHKNDNTILTHSFSTLLSMNITPLTIAPTNTATTVERAMKLNQDFIKILKISICEPP